MKIRKIWGYLRLLGHFVHYFSRFDTFQDGMSLVDIIAEELGLPRHALDEER